MKKAKTIKDALTRTQLKAAIVKLLGLLDKARNGPMCRIHGNHPGQLAYHLIPQQRGDAARFIEENVVWACRKANFGEMMNRSLYDQKHIDLFGEARINRIKAEARKIKKYTMYDLRMLRFAIALEIEQASI